MTGNSFDEAVLIHDETPGYIYATFDGLNLTDGQYTVFVTGINKLDVESERVTTNVTILTAKPAINGRLFSGYSVNISLVYTC